MADPSFEPGHPRDSAIELGRIVDRGFKGKQGRRHQITLCHCGKVGMAIRIDLHIIDNGG
ncbi:polyribonucleotide nucleotidyltransferase, PNPase/RNase PH domain protein [Artemisia annua]|uniref:Polyribonucleotide nucleotidyltransferase, PNPase/RNase PH domain protein n=1 Tax=Artemisia annua TaxID=35608 RepID=A0A2U1L3E0_ARTAN|nr:polyribonucleotide nucleotidyltransferase, PNPase/RNase PH domain protein [Artemisia annua]